MLEFDQNDLLRETAGCWRSEAPDVPITGFSNDTRTLREGEVFVALRTGRRDGHDFVPAARQAGASLALVDRIVEDPLPQLLVGDALRALQVFARWHRRRFTGPVIGITGSCGKTSTRKLLHSLLGPGTTHATEGNLNNEIGVPLTLLRLDPATHTRAVIETGINTTGEMVRLAAMIEPDGTVFTMVGAAHLEGLGSLEGVAREKSELLRATRQGGFGVVTESAWRYRPVAGWIRERGGIVCVPAGSGWSRNEGIDVWEREARDGENRRTVRLSRALDGRILEYEMPPVSDGMISNSTLAAIVADRLGVDGAILRKRMAEWSPVENRGVWMRSGRVRIYLDSYNANPSSMEDALEAFMSRTPDGRERLFVLGGMHELGPDSASFHAKVVSRLNWRPQDTFWLVGARALEYLDGFEGTLVEEDRILHRDQAKSFFPAMENLLREDRAIDIFIKGSRFCGLEGLLPPEILSSVPRTD